MKPNKTALLTRLGGGLRRPGPFQRTTRITLSLLLVLSHPLWAATIIVDETTCTLVDAITAANTDAAVGGCAAGSGADTIQLTTDVTLTEVNNSVFGLPIVESEINVEGGGFTIEREPNAPEFCLLKSVDTLSLNDLRLLGGSSPASCTGGISLGGDAFLTDVEVSGNSGGNSGGISVSGGMVTLTNSTISDNWGYHQGGIGVFGGATVSLTNCTLTGNSGATGGIYNGHSEVIVVSSTISGNSAILGGGIYNSYEGSVTITDSTISDNAAQLPGGGWGGGIINAYDGSVTVTNSTISGNSARHSGGGIFNTSIGPVTVTNSTISGNSAMFGGGIRRFSSGNVELSGTIVANSPSGGSCWGEITDNGNNFDDDDSCGPGFAPITPDVDFDTTLAENGGPTLTHALLPGSVAIDAAGVCGLPTDQRGYLRWDGTCDSGSFEYGATPPDADQDGVPDAMDFCLDTTIPESVPTNHLQVNRWALVDDDNIFDTTAPPGGSGGPDFAFTVADTGGCSCEQIIEAWALGWGHTKFGCSTGVMLQWTAYVGDYSLAQIENESGQPTASAIQTPVESGDNPSASTQGTVSDPESRRQQSLTPRRTPRPHNNRN